LLHRLIYISAVCAAIHYLWKVKVMIGSPVYYAIVIGLLLGFRVLWQLRSAKLLKTQRVTA
jgi:methionine sulfoxide reductase heme-binding subunit